MADSHKPGAESTELATAALTGRTSAMTTPIDTWDVLTPAIDTRVRADYAVAENVLTLQGELHGDDFPNAEVYVTDRVGNSLMLHMFQTEGGRQLGPVLHLPGEGEDELGLIDATIPLNTDGSFRMTCE